MSKRKKNRYAIQPAESSPKSLPMPSRYSTGEYRLVQVFVEGYDDVAFWRGIFDDYETEWLKFEISVPPRQDLAKGKKVLLGMIGECCDDRILCVDSDFDYLFEDFNEQSRQVNRTPYLFHTYAYATENRPHIKAERLRLESAENAVRIAKSALYPSLSLRGGYGTGIYSTQEAAFGTQFRKNSSEFVGVSMSVPIFNRRATHNSILSARIAMRKQAIAAQGDRAGVVQRRRRLREIPFGGRRPHLGTGGLRLRTAEGRRRPFDGLRLQRRQNTYGKGRVGTRAGEIRIRIPVENPRLLPRPAARTMTNSRKQARTE